MASGRLNDALEALLYSASARRDFMAGDLSRFALSPEDADALRALDREQVASAAQIAMANVFERTHRGVGTLVEAFAETIASWKAAHPGESFDRLAEAFVASPQFAGYRAHPFAGPGTCLEEAFFRFAEEQGIGTEAIRLRECAFAILCTLATTPEPAFVLPEFVRRAPRGFYVVSPHGPTLLAVLGGKLVRGPITPHVAALLTSTAAPEPKDDVVRAELARMGLIALR